MKYTLVFVLCAYPLAAANEWVRISSPNFEMYTNAGAKDARKTIEYFEQVRDFFMRTKSAGAATKLPVTIVGFRGPKDYKPYPPNESAAAYYLGDENRDYIVMGSVGEENFAVATHEYMHLLIRHTGMKLPVWLNEGIADVYSSLKPYGGKIMIGDVLKGRAYLLSQQKWMPLPKLLAIQHDSPEYNEKDRSGILYAQSWLLAHMLMLGQSYMPEFGKLLESVHDTQSPEKSFQSVYGKTLADVDKDLRAYYRGSVRAALFPTKLEKMTVAEPHPATDTQVGIVLARITGMLRRYDDAESRLKELALKDPDSAEIHEALGHLYWRKLDNAKAREHLGRAVELNSPSWKTYWDFARLAQDAPPEDKLVIVALEKAVGMNPELIDARMMLGQRYYSSSQFGLAAATLGGIKRVTPEMAPRYFLMLAHVNLRLKNNEEAKKAALQVKKYAKDAADISRADEMIAYIDQPVREPVARAARAANEPPILRRREAPATTWDVQAPDPKEQLGAVRGVLTEIECAGEKAKLRIAVGNTSLAFLIRDPARVYIKGAKPNEQLLSCGKTRKTVTVEYLPKDDRSTGTVGEARIIDFTAAAK